MKSGGAEWEFETYLVNLETYSVLWDYETKKTTGAPAPTAPTSLAPMQISKQISLFGILKSAFCIEFHS